MKNAAAFNMMCMRNMRMRMFACVCASFSAKAN